MKKTANNWLLLMMMFCASFAFFSCSSSDSDEDEDLDNVSGIIGTWKEDDEFNSLGGETYLQFKKDGTFYEVDIYDDGDIEVDKAKWEAVGGNRVRVSGGTGPTVYAEIISVSKKELVLDFFVELRYKKVSDSAIDKYIK